MATPATQRGIGAALALVGLALTSWQWFAVVSDGFILLGVAFWGMVLFVIGLANLAFPQGGRGKRLLVGLLAFAYGSTNYYVSAAVFREKLLQKREKLYKGAAPPLGPAEDRPPVSMLRGINPFD